jgi:hypothetical protein
VIIAVTTRPKGVIGSSFSLDFIEAYPPARTAPGTGDGSEVAAVEE